MKFLWFGNKKSKDEKRSLTDCPIVTSSESVGGTLSNQLHQIFNPSGLNLSPLFAAINIISNSCGNIPWKFINDKNAELLKRTHYLYHLFDDVQVSRFLSIKNTIKDVLIKGNGFLYIDRDTESGRPKSLLYLPVDTVNVFVDITNNVPYYACSYYPNKFTKYISADNIIHFKMHSKDGIVGVGLPIFAQNTIETATYTENAITNYMSSGGNVTGILTPNQTNPNIPTTKKQINEIRASWDEARANKGSSTIILPADLKFTQLSTSAKDAALIDTRLYNLQEIARWFNISPVLLGDLSHSQYNSISEAQREFVEHTLQPFIVMMEEELNKKLIMPSKKGVERIDLDERTILIPDKEKQANYLINLVTKGIITPNEARKELDLPEVEGADKLIIAYTNLNNNQVGENLNSDEENSGDNNNNMEDKKVQQGTSESTSDASKPNESVDEEK